MYSLFRQEAVDNQKTQHYGDVFINTPLNDVIFAGSLVCFLLLLALFFLLASFSEQFVVRGYLNSSKGVIRIYPSKNGVIKKVMVHHGQMVQKGDALFLIDTSKNEEQQDALINNLRKQEARVLLEIDYKKNELAKIKSLLDKKYISLAYYHRKAEEIAVFEKNRDLIELERIRYQDSQSYLIRSPIAGVISSLIYHTGQYTSSGKPLAKLLPAHAKLLAEIFVPVREAGFLQQGNRVLLHYDAYPSVRFGSAAARLSEISQSILTDEEEEKPFNIGEPYYKVNAILDKQALMLVGKSHPLSQGMTLSATLMGPKKKLWQWVFDPLYNYGSVG